MIIRDRLSLLLAETRSQRSLVIRAFMTAGRRIEREGKVFLSQSKRMARALRTVLGKC